MDLNGKPIVYRRRGDVSHSSKENREEQAIICTVASEHVYNIQDPILRDKICKSVSHSHLPIQGSNIIERSFVKTLSERENVYLQDIPKSFEDN